MVTKLNVGDEIEWTCRGKVTSVKISVLHAGQQVKAEIKGDSGITHIVYPSLAEFSVVLKEKVPEEGAVYMDDNGDLYYRLRESEKKNKDPWMSISDRISWRESTPLRPLTKMVPEDK